jgi:hypothetical protein
MPTHRSTPGFIALLVLVILALAGCGGANQAAPTENSEAVTGPEREAPPLYREAGEAAPVEEAPAVAETAAEGGEAEMMEEAASEDIGRARDEVAAAESEPLAPPAAPADLADRDTALEYETAESTIAALPTASPAPIAAAAESLAADEAYSGESSREVTIVQAEPLRAGEVDDNAAWDDYLLYRRNYGGFRVHDRDVSERYIIEVEDGQGEPVLGASVRVFLTGQERQEIYSARTYANGQVLFHPLALDIPTEQVDRFIVEVQKDDLLQQFTLTRFDAQATTSFSERWSVRLDTQSRLDTLDLDVLFLIDATGSMADEIAKIQSTIFDVAAQVDSLPGQPNVRYGMVTYRDRGDSYVSNTYEFTPDVREFHRNLSSVFADGGGDYPESLNEGLHDALDAVEWRGGETIQLIFLIADAPPHLDYANDYDYAEEMADAARRGIKIFPIASSGLDDQGEYIFRQLAQYTQGRFIFLTYEGPTNSGAPGEVTTHHVDDYSVANLDDLLVRLVTEELAYQSPRLARAQ